MKSESDLIYKIALSHIKGIGDITAKKLISYCGNAELVFKESKKSLSSIPNINKKTLDFVNSEQAFRIAEKEIEFMIKNNVNHLFYTDKDYPNRLKLCVDSPINIYYKGNISWNESKFISIVGTRKCSVFGKEYTENIVKQLSDYDVVIVSGLAFGIDVAAHKSALKNNLKTVAVLAHGLDRIYPTQHASIAKEIVESGSLLSDYKSGTVSSRQNFPSRNRIVAGLSDATIVLECSKEGGSLITADIAHSYNRDVFAVPGKPTDKSSEGCNDLIKNHKAILLENADDIIKNLNWDVTKVSVQKNLFEGLTKEEELIFEVLKEKQLDIDDIKHQLQWSSSLVAKNLLQMEFKDMILSLPGKMYKRKM